MSMRALCRSVSAVVLCAAGPLTSQCANVLLPGSPVPGIAGSGSILVRCSTSYDPDGPGALPAVLAFAGAFTVAGNVEAQNVATWDPSTGTWSPLGGGLLGIPVALAALPNGDLVAGGFLPLHGSSSFARWNGSTWAPMPGFSGSVTALQVAANGDLIVAGQFTVAGLGSVSLARWDGSSWFAFGGAVLGGSVESLCALANGDLVVGGSFTSIGGLPVNSVARWNGVAWSALGTGCNGPVRALTALANGDIVAGGDFMQAGGTLVSRVARWNGSTWLPMHNGLSASVRALAVSPAGSLVAGGDFILSGSTVVYHLAVWSGSAWQPVAGGFGDVGATVYTLAPLTTGQFVVGGQFRRARDAAGGHTFAACLALGQAVGLGTLTALVSGTVGGVFASATLPNGDLVVGGGLESIGGVDVTGIARRSGGIWSPLGLGADATRALVVLPGGDLVVGGYFTSAGGLPIRGLARWSGGTWSALGPLGGPFPAVRALSLMPGGDLVVGGYFTSAGGVVASNVARWNGATWSGLGGGVGGPGVTVLATAAMPNGDLVVGGLFTTAGGQPASNIARWNGATWSALGSGVNGGVYALAVRPNGELIVGGDFTSAGSVAASLVARWNGTTWSSLGSGVSGGASASVLDLEVLPNGDVLAGGSFSSAGGQAVRNLARWNGVGWSPIGLGVDSTVWSLARLPGDDVLVGGDFWSADGSVAVSLSQLTTTCPAGSIAFGASCPSSGGSNTLVTKSLPWLASEFRATGSGLPLTAFVVAATSVTPLSPALPIANVLPLVGPGCLLHTAPEVLSLLATTTGTVESSFVLPSTVSLVGATFFHQLVPLEVDAVGNLLQVTATNALQLTIGAF